MKTRDLVPLVDHCQLKVGALALQLLYDLVAEPKLLIVVVLPVCLDLRHFLVRIGLLTAERGRHLDLIDSAHFGLLLLATLGIGAQ